LLVNNITATKKVGDVMLNVNDIRQAIRSTEYTVEEKHDKGESVSAQREKLSYLNELLKAVEQGLVRK
jgi:hypothetical protein